MTNGFLFARTVKTSVSLNCENGDFHEKFLGHCTLSDGGILLHAHATGMFSFNLHHKNVSFKVSSLGTGKSRILTLKPLESTSEIAEFSLMGLETTEFVKRPAAICGISFTTLAILFFVGYLLRERIQKNALPLPSFGRTCTSNVVEFESQAVSGNTDKLSRASNVIIVIYAILLWSIFLNNHVSFSSRLLRYVSGLNTNE